MFLRCGKRTSKFRKAQTPTGLDRGPHPATRRKQATMNPSGNLERILESAVVNHWTDLTPDTPTGLIHIEYGFADGGTLDYLKLWSSLSRGHWLLACEYWMSANTFHEAGISFSNGY